MKKTWQSPQLVILTRSEPEESVLSACKSDFKVTGSAYIRDSECDWLEGCAICQAITRS